MSSDATPARILIVDDNKDAASGLGRLLMVLGKEVRVVHSGAEALAAISEFRPHLALLDLGMPGMDGLETARQIRAQPGGQPTILVAITGWGEKEDRQRTELAGFAAHLVKPIKAEALEAALDRLLG